MVNDVVGGNTSAQLETPQAIEVPTREASYTDGLCQHRADEVLLARIRNRDETALAQLYDTHRRMIFSVAMRILRDAGQAEDVLHDVFLRIWRQPPAFEARGALGAWLAVVSRNRAIDLLRVRRPSEQLEDHPITSRGDLYKDMERSLMVDRLLPLIAGLPLVQREALEMAFFRHLSHAEISQITAIPLGTVKTRIRNALLKLEKALADSSKTLLPSEP